MIGGDSLNLRFNLRILLGEGIEGVGDGLDEGVECSCRGFSQRGLEFRESLFDWIKVGAIGRQIAHCRAGLLDCFRQS